MEHLQVRGAFPWLYKSCNFRHSRAHAEQRRWPAKASTPQVAPPQVADAQAKAARHNTSTFALDRTPTPGSHLLTASDDDEYQDHENDPEDDPDRGWFDHREQRENCVWIEQGRFSS
jgi:hypothetical protein